MASRDHDSSPLGVGSLALPIATDSSREGSLKVRRVYGNTQRLLKFAARERENALRTVRETRTSRADIFRPGDLERRYENKFRSTVEGTFRRCISPFYSTARFSNETLHFLSSPFRLCLDWSTQSRETRVKFEREVFLYLRSFGDFFSKISAYSPLATRYLILPEFTARFLNATRTFKYNSFKYVLVWKLLGPGRCRNAWSRAGYGPLVPISRALERYLISGA